MMISVQPQKEMVLDDINLNNTGKCGRRINTRKGVKVDTSLTFNQAYIYIYTRMCARKISTLKMIGGKIIDEQ